MIPSKVNLGETHTISKDVLLAADPDFVLASAMLSGHLELEQTLESCGIAVSDTEGPKGKVDYYKDMGLVNEVFDEERLNRLHGNIGVMIGG